ncbi:MAG: hypothetical protein WEB06_10555 [Actinomycetota bacterium]
MAGKRTTAGYGPHTAAARAEIAATAALVRSIGREASRFRDADKPVHALRTAYRDEYRRLLGDEREKLGLRREA